MSSIEISAPMAPMEVEVFSGASPYPLATTHDFSLIRAMAALSRASGTVATVALILMAFSMCYEIFSRYVLNSPTAWATEISGYLLVATVFFGLAAAQASNSHVQVELWVDRLSATARLQVELLCQWLALLFCVVLAWQMASFNAREYVNDTRDWGLLSTPQWIPELAVSLGLLTFCMSILVDLYRLSPPAAVWRRWLAPAALALMVMLLAGLGANAVPLAGTRLDWGMALIALAFTVSVWAWSGGRCLLRVLAIVGGCAVLYALARGQSLGWLAALLVASMMLLLFLGVRIGVALGLVGLFGVYFLLSRPQLSLLAERAWSSTNTFTLTAVPMFIFMGGLLLRSGITSGMFDSLVRWFGRAPGGLAHASAGASAVFAAVSGSSLATAATLGKAACPDMIARGYSPRLTYGVAAGGATLGILIPPSIPMIIYGTTVGASVTHLFLAGIIPGLVLMGCFMLGVLVWALMVPGAAPVARSYTLREKMGASRSMIPFVVIIGAVLGSMYAGVATPTEAAAIGAVSAFVLCLLRRQLTWKALIEIAQDSAKVTALLLLIVVGASIFSWVFDYLRLPREVVNLIEGADVPPVLVMGAMVLIYLVLGMFVESIAMMLMTLPVTYPIAMALGLDPIWFGVFLVLMIEVGLITPPVGMVLFVLRSMNEKARFTDIMRGALPFVLIILLFLGLIYVFPQIVMWLPQQVS
ncbi:TRAP transporter large permease subunit [Bordetella tumulicola]|uniref:TRAP transporter large permease subunit n=1 Tax=Bordetella tumulicola TaxID=1649133 RepID=UPI0039EE65B8